MVVLVDGGGGYGFSGAGAAFLVADKANRRLLFEQKEFLIRLKIGFGVLVKMGLGCI